MVVYVPGSVEAVEAGGGPVVERIRALGVEGLGAEYAEVRMAADPPALTMKASSQRENRIKNRYKDVGCWDHTRVRLEEAVGTEDGEDASDYIHANFVDGSRWPREYIAAQSPMEHTIEEFWHMAWEQNVSLIIMLCLPMENGRRKSEQYWKVERGGVMVLNTGYKVTTMDRETIRLQDHHLVQTNLSIVRAGDPTPRNIIHILHTNWPDKSLPPSAEPVYSLLRKVEVIHRLISLSNGLQPRESPKLVHCSAGVGRTGTLIAVDIAMGAVCEGLPPSLPEVVLRLRRQRKHAVQTIEQYVFLYLVTAEFVLARCPALCPDAGALLTPLRLQRPPASAQQ